MSLTILPETILRDLRFGIRMLCRTPGFTFVAVLALTIGIGVNTAVFTAYKAMLARPLDARKPGEMVNIALTRDAGATDYTFRPPDYEHYRDSVHSFSGLIAFSPERMTLSNAGGLVSERTSAAGSAIGKLGLLASGAKNAEFASVFVVSENYFRVLGMEPLRGRGFDSIALPELAASPSVLISENYWQERFAGDPALLGKIVHLNGAPFTVIGITPRDFVGTGVAVPGFWLPLSLAPAVNTPAVNKCCRLFARLAPGATLGQAQAEMTLVANRLRALHRPRSESAPPTAALVWPGSPFPLPLDRYPGLKLTVLLIMAAAGMVLAVACANVAGLQSARARSRHNELRTRLSLGANRSRLIGQLLTESSLLALLAGAAALLFTWALLKVAVVLVSRALPVEYGTLIFNVAPDPQIFACVFGISLMAGVLFGLAPALESSRSALASGVREGTSPVRARRLQDLLIAAQVSLSLVLLIAGSMLIRSSLNSLTIPTGYDAGRVIDLSLQFTEAPKYTAARKLALTDALRARLVAMPGVAEVTAAFAPGDNRFRTMVDGKSLLHYTLVEANYFRTLGIPLLEGRGFQSPSAQPERTVILSESAARRLWTGQNPIGRSVRLGPSDERSHDLNEPSAEGAAWLVIGVVRDTRGAEIDGSDAGQIYLPLPRDRMPDRSLLIRARSDPAEVIRALDPPISAVDPELPTTSSTLQEMLRRSPSFIVSSLAAAIASTVGLLGLLLASMGVYGTVSYIVVLRTREVGIRMAVGAQRRDILGLILAESARPVLAGLFIGMLLSVGASYLLRSLLYGLQRVDGFSYAAVSLLFLATALLAAWPPSRRAMRVDPVVALRYE